VHSRLPVQFTPQKPQLLLLCDRLAQTFPPPPKMPPPPVHCVVGGTQRTTHVLSEQRGVLPPQRLPHDPQFALFAVVSTQLPRPIRIPNEHWVRPAAQPQVPSVHEPPNGQNVPHDPQFVALVSVSTQVDIMTPPRPIAVHMVSPPSPQPAAHMLSEQVVPPRHALPQRPQFALFEVGSTHVMPHRMSDEEHWHIPPTQLPPLGHWCAHVPQLLGSVWVLTHAFEQFASVAPESVVQLTVQTPVLQTGVPAGQTFPQAPQLFGSLCVGVQIPLHRMPL